MSKQLYNKLGTPTTLAGAIQNAMEFEPDHHLTDDALIALIASHVRDFLAQKFAALLLEANDTEALLLKKLWEKITGETLCLTTGAQSPSISNTSASCTDDSRERPSLECECEDCGKRFTKGDEGDNDRFCLRCEHISTMNSRGEDYECRDFGSDE